MKKTLLFSGLALASLALASCGGSKEESHSSNTESGSGSGSQQVETGKTINLKYSGDAAEEAINQELFAKFKKARKAAGDKNTYNIEYVGIGAGDVDSKVLDWTAKTAPDVFEYASDKINNLYKAGAVAEITGKGEKFIEDNYTDLAITNSTFANGYYGYTFCGDNTYYLQYDKSVLTAEDVKSVEGIIAKLSSTGKKLGYNLSNAFFSAGVLFTFDADYSVTFDNDGNISNVSGTFNTVKGQKGIKAMAKIIQSGVIVDECKIPTADNNYVGCVAGTWDIANYKKALGDNYACAPMPTITIDGETEHLGSFLGTKLLGVNATRSSDKDRYNAAHELAMYLAGEEAQLYRFEKKNIIPCFKSALTKDTVKNNENYKVLTATIPFGHPQGPVPGGVWTAPKTVYDTITSKDTKYTEDMVPAMAEALNTAIVGA